MPTPGLNFLFGIFFLVPAPVLHLLLWRATAPAGGEEPGEWFRFWASEALGLLAGLGLVFAFWRQDPGLFREGVPLTMLFLAPPLSGMGCIVFPFARFGLFRGAHGTPAVGPRRAAAFALAGLAAMPPFFLGLAYLTG